MSSPRTAIVVDDHEENVYLLRTLLESSGCQVVTARNGVEALEQARLASPDIIISDILMPVMDGFTLCRACKADPLLSKIPFVFYTATYTDPKDERLALGLGADLFLVKPIEPQVFLEQIADVLQRQQAGLLPGRRETPSGEDAVLGSGEYLEKYSAALVRKLEDKLVQLEEANRALALRSAVIDASISGIALADRDGRCTYANPSFGRIWGVPASSLRGQPLAELVLQADARAMVVSSVKTSGSWIGEVRSRRLDGTPLVVQGVVEKIADGEGTPLCLMVSCIDVTERSRMRDELQRTERLELLNVFARSIAHDFNNLLMGLLGNLELGMRGLPAGSPVLKYLEIATSIYERARSLTQRLQAFAKGGPAERKPVALADLLRECGSLSLSGSNVRFELSSHPELPAVEADPNQLSQVFNNLLLNARQAMPGGGTVSVTLSRRTVSDGEAGGLRAGEYVEATVKDEGPGIPEDVLPRIFDPFFTTKRGGSGLGLATSDWIVKDHGGQIRVTSSRGGASFAVWLPATAGAPSLATELPRKELSGVGRILVMDDESTVRDTVRRMLSLAGYEVVTTADGDAALEVCARASAAGQPFDLVLLDVTVRGGAGGLDTLKRLRGADPGAAVILSSGYHDEAVIERARALGCSGFIQKPYMSHELLSRVQAAIGTPQP